MSVKALIIAAGRGSRLKGLTKDEPKPLIKLLGLSLVERVILTAKRAGIDEFVMVIGYLGERIREELGDGDRYGVKVTYIENREWERGNGVSVLKAKELLNEEFVLLMADHLFDVEILHSLLKTRLEGDECVLVVDKRPPDYIDLREATKVKVRDDKIVDIGKRMKEYDAIDCGIFLCTQSIFKALDESIKDGDETLSGGINVLSRAGRVKAFEIKDNFWIDIDTKSDYNKAEKILCEKLIKPTDGPVSKFLNRPISIRISKLLVRTKIKPNTISILSFFIALLSALFFSLGDYLYIIIAGILSQLGSIVDGCDGEVARLKFQQSDYGAWFDAVLDRYADALIISGMAYGYWLLHSDIKIWITGVIALTGSFMNSYTAIKLDSILINNKNIPRIRFGRDIRLFLIMAGAVLNQIFYTLIIIGILTNAESIRRLYTLRNR